MRSPWYSTRGQPVRLARVLLDDAEARDALQHDVVAAVRQQLALVDPAGAADRIDGRAAW